MSTKQTPQIYADLHSIMALCRGIKPSGSMRGASYAEIGQVVAMVREALLSVGVLMLPSLTSETRGAKNAKDAPVHLTEARLSVRFVSLADQSEITVVWEGMKIDQGDKSLSIAATLALKQLLLTMFLIPVDEKIATEEETTELEQAREEWKNIAAETQKYKPVFYNLLAAVGQNYNGSLWRPREGFDATRLRKSAAAIGYALSEHQSYVARYKELCEQADEMGIEYTTLLSSATRKEIRRHGETLGKKIEAAQGA